MSAILILSGIPDAQTKMSVSEKSSHVIRIHSNKHTQFPFTPAQTLHKYAGSLQTGLRMSGRLFNFSDSFNNKT